MSGLGLDPTEEQQLLQQDDPVQQPAAPGFFGGSLGAPFLGIASGALKAGAPAAAGSLTPDYNPMLGAMGGEIFPTEDSAPTGAEGMTDEAFDRERRAAISRTLSAFRPDPKTTGFAGELLFGITDLGSRYVAGSALGGPLGGAALAGGSEGYAATQDQIAAGVDPETAQQVGVIQGGAAAIGGLLPVGFGATTLAKVGSGAALNVGVGAVSRGTTAGVLEANGYTKQAEQFKWLDAQSLVADVVLGAGFGYIASPHAAALGERLFAGSPPEPAQIAAAAVANQQQHAEIGTAPGIVVDAASRDAHTDNLSRATEAMLADEPVPAMADVSTVPNPQAEAFQRSVERADPREALGLTDEQLDAEGFGLPPVPRSLPDDSPLLADTSLNATPERQALRESVIEQHFEGVEPAPSDRKPIAYVMAGGGASGKGTILAQLKRKGLVPDRGAVEIDPDGIKRALPEYQALLDQGDGRAASVVHEESSVMARAVLARALQRKTDVVLDRTFGDAAKGVAELTALRDAGYEVRMYGVTVDPAIAVQRAVGRAVRSGRHVPIKALLTAHKGFAASFEKYAKLVDSFDLFDNSGKVPRVIASKGEAGLEVFDKNLYDALVERSSINETATTIRSIGPERRQQGGPESGPVPGDGSGDQTAAGRRAETTAQDPRDVPAKRLIDRIRDYLRGAPKEGAKSEVAGSGAPKPAAAESTPVERPDDGRPVNQTARTAEDAGNKLADDSAVVALSERPDMQIFDGAGNPVSAAAALAEADAVVAQAKQEAGLFEVAATCYLRAGE